MRTIVAAIFVMVMLLTGTASAQAPEEPHPVYSGSWLLFDAESVTVVYPAGPGEDVPTNRRSAEWRAAFLREAHGVSTTVAADDAVPQERLEANLLLLGWNNRLLARAGLPRPVETTPSGRNVLGIFEVPSGQDLFFISASPYATDEPAMLAFWSRIDLEKDRFSVLPYNGSSWAVYDGYRPVDGGMFVPATSWPPTRDPAREQTPVTPLPGVLQRSEHYVLHADPSHLTAEEISEVLEQRERAWAAASSALGAPRTGDPITLYVYPDRKIKKEFTAVGDAVHSEPWDSVLHMILAAARRPSPHEEIHLVARRQIGPCSLSSFFEGLSVALESAGGGQNELYLYAASMIERDETIELDLFLDEGTFRRRMKQPDGLPAAGLFALWIRQRLSDDAFRRAYTAPLLSMDELAELAGTDASTLRQEWTSWVQASASSVEAEFEHRRLLAEAKILRDKSDHAGSARMLEKALEAKPGDASTLYRLAVALTWAEEYDAAEAALRGLLELAGEDPAQSSWRLFAHYQLGRGYQRRGLVEEARQEYRLALEQPDRRGVHAQIHDTLASLDGEDGEGD